MSSHRILKPCSGKLDCGCIFGSIEIEVTRDNHRAFGILPHCVKDYFPNLRDPQVIVAAALKMKVVDYDLAPRDAYLGYQSDSSSEPLLKWLHARQKPARLPEIRLLRKPDQAWFRNRPLRESDLPMVSGRILRTLHKLLKLSSEHIVHLQLPRDLFGDV
jgi:hypothetical protein